MEPKRDREKRMRMWREAEPRGKRRMGGLGEIKSRKRDVGWGRRRVEKTEEIRQETNREPRDKSWTRCRGSVKGRGAGDGKTNVGPSNGVEPRDGRRSGVESRGGQRTWA